MLALLIDDSVAMRNYLGSMLEELGVEVLTGGNGQEGLDVLASSDSPDVILVDWNMPVMDGIEFVDNIRSNPAYQGLSVIMVTSESEMSSVMHALESGVDEYVIKPFTEEDLEEKLRIAGVLS